MDIVGLCDGLNWVATGRPDSRRIGRVGEQLLSLGETPTNKKKYNVTTTVVPPPPSTSRRFLTLGPARARAS